MKFVSRHFLEGYAQVLDGWVSVRNYEVELPKDLKNLTPQSDRENLRNDVRAVGRDMRTAIDKVSHTYQI